MAMGILACAISGLTVAPSPAAAARVAVNPDRHQVTLGFDKVEPGRRVSHGIPVSRASGPRGARARAVYSVRLPRLRPRQRLLIRGVVAVTRCNRSDARAGGGAHQGALHSPCESVRHPYRAPSGGQYDPKIGVRAFLGSRRRELGRGIGEWKVRRCTTGIHHCPLEVRTQLHKPPRRRGAWLNLAVTAFSPKARLGRRGRPVDVIELDGDCKHHDLNPDSGYCVPVLKSASSNTAGVLTAIRFGASRHPARPRTSHKLINRHLRVQASRRSIKTAEPRIILRERVRHLSPGDVIDADARFHLRDHPGGRYVFRHAVRGLLFLSPNPHGLSPHASSGSPGRWLSGVNGTNCPHRTGCEIEKLGAATVPKGARRTMWVTYVAWARDRGGVDGALTDITRGRLNVAIDRAG